MKGNSTYTPGLVSVIMPTYKRSEKLPRAIESILEQTYKDIELMVVNDNDPNDEFTQYVKSITKKYNVDPRFRLIIQDKHINGAVARNVAIRQAKGEYIAFLDDDDWWELNKIEEQVKVLSSLDSSWGGVSCKFSQYDAEGNVIARTRKYSDGFIYKEILYMYTEVATGTLLLRHKALDDSGYFDENLLRSQDIQLLTNFTFKYKLKEVDQYLHCADCSDGQNRLADETKYLVVMNAFLESVRPVLETLTKREMQCVISMRYFTLGYLLLKQKQYKKGIKYCLSIFRNSLTLVTAIKLVNKKRLEKKFAKNE